jgi:hypothetical protein
MNKNPENLNLNSRERTSRGEDSHLLQDIQERPLMSRKN